MKEIWWSLWEGMRDMSVLLTSILEGGEKMTTDILYVVTSIYVISGVTWRIVCLFRKKGSCRFRRCPFRKDYTSMSCLYFPSGGCTKCPPTPEELETYRHSAEGIVESILNESEKL